MVWDNSRNSAQPNKTVWIAKRTCVTCGIPVAGQPASPVTAPPPRLSLAFCLASIRLFSVPVVELARDPLQMHYTKTERN